MAFPVGAAILGGATIASAGASAYAQGRMNRAQRQFAQEQAAVANDRAIENWKMQNEYNEKMWGVQNQYNEGLWNKQNEYNEKLWNQQNAYNAPTAQMERYKEAGLNPHLIYGASNMGGSINTSNLEAAPMKGSDTPGVHKPEWYPKAPQFDFHSGIASIFDQQEQAARTNNLEAMNKVYEQQVALTAANVADVGARTARSKFDLGQAMELNRTSIDAAKESLRKMQNENMVLLDRNQREAAMQTSNLAEAAERIQNYKGQRQNMQLDAELKKLDLKLKELGIQPHDAAWMRILGRKLYDWGIIKDGGSLENGWKFKLD